MTDAMVDKENQRNPIMPANPAIMPREIRAPDLLHDRYFKSEHGGTPPISEVDSDIISVQREEPSTIFKKISKSKKGNTRKNKENLD